MLFSLFNLGYLDGFSSVKLDNSKLQYASSTIQMYDNLNNLYVGSSLEQKNLTFEEIPKETIDAFISIEDKKFFTHKGINYKRLIKATLNNLSNFKLLEGASTITQQLIKNTHLSSEKTLKRKFDEIILAQKLEKTLSKNDIITAYLNAIYFGNGAFGLNNASQRYYSKKANDLTLQESATLAGIIKSPKTFSPIYNENKCLQRRNLVLSEMYKDNKISVEEYNKAKSEPLGLNINKNFLGENNYYSESVDEACKILKITEKDLLLKKYKINTYLDSSLQEVLKNEITKLPNYSKSDEADGVAIVIDNKTGGIKGFYGKSDYNILSLNRQPGSVFKPIIAYAPALEYNIISPLTPILDEKININGYLPRNYKNNYHGWVSAKTSLANSYNIPAIKILKYVKIDNAKNFAKKMNINFDSKDNGESLALGGLTNGLNILKVANCYQTFANNGCYIPAKFVKSIIDSNGKTIYQNNENNTRVMKDSTAYLITDMLKESVKNGTCKKLNIDNYEIASKTGTVASSTSKENENSDVWNISYTPDDTVCVWFGNTKKTMLNETVTGANGPTAMAQKIYTKGKLSSNKFSIPDSVSEQRINEMNYLENNKILLADNDTPDRFCIKSYFANDFLPEEKSEMFNEIDDFIINVSKNNDEILLNFTAKKHLKYDIYRACEDNIVKIQEISNKQGNVEIVDKNIKKGNFYNYYAIAQYNNSQQQLTKKSNEVKIFLAQK